MNNENGAKAPEKKFSFRKSLGGFKKKDVIEYISEENRKFSEERADLGAKLAEQTAKAEDAAKKTSEFQLYYELLLKKKADEIASLSAQLEEAKKSAEESDRLREEAEAAKKSAEEFEAKVAEIAAKCNELNEELEREKESHAEEVASITAEYEEKIKEASCAPEAVEEEAKEDVSEEEISEESEPSPEAPAEESTPVEEEDLAKEEAPDDVKDEIEEKIEKIEKVEKVENVKKAEEPKKLATKFFRVPKGTNRAEIERLLKKGR